MAFFKKTLEQVKKAYEDLSDEDKKAFHQSIADRIHESIGEQEHDKGDKDSQSAADREHEALGEEHAEGKGDVEELHETDPEPEGKNDSEGGSAEEEKAPESDVEKTEEPDESAVNNGDEILKGLTDRVAALEASLKEIDGLRERLQEYEDKQRSSFGLPGKPIGGKKDMRDMSADELKTAILSGQK